MAVAQISVRVDSRLKRALTTVCKMRGVKIGRFVEDALLDKLEELEDIEDIKSLRKEPTKPFKDVMKALGLHGKI